MGIQVPSDDGGNGPRLDDLRGKVLILRPIEYLRDVRTRFGTNTAWAVDAWEWTTDPRNPFVAHADLRVFTQAIKKDLHAAKRDGNDLLGRLVRRDGLVMEKLTPEETRTCVAQWEAWSAAHV